MVSTRPGKRRDATRRCETRQIDLNERKGTGKPVPFSHGEMMTWKEIKTDIKKGWDDANWSWYFSWWLLPGMILAFLLDTWIEGPLPPIEQPPRPLALVFMALATAHALWRVRHRLPWPWKSLFKSRRNRDHGW